MYEQARTMLFEDFSFMRMFLFCLAICIDSQTDQKDERQPERYSHIDRGTEQHKKSRNDDEY
jgi:hypothetical protein